MAAPKNTAQNKILNHKTPKASRIKKGTIILLVGIIALIVLLMVISGFSRNNQTHYSNHSSSNSNSLGINNSASSTSLHQKTRLSGLNQLPGSYQHAAQIQAILNKDHSKSNLSKQLQQEINQLKQQQKQLKNQLINSQNNSNNLSQPVSPMDQEASASSIFFAGGAPAIKNGLKSLTAKQMVKAVNSKKSSSQLPSSYTDYSNQNMQQAKLDFLTSKPNKNIYNNNTVQYPASKYILQAGSSIPAVLQTKIISNLPGNIVAIVRSNVYDSISGQYLLIPKGSKLIGQYSSRLSYGQNQIQIKFTRLIRPDGSSIVLPNQQGVNNQGVAGLSDSVNNHWGSIIGTAALSALFNIPAIVATNEMNNSNSCYQNSSGVMVCSNGLGAVAKASALQAVGQSTAQIGSKLAGKSLNLQPTVTIHAGYNFSVMVTKDIILPPYHLLIPQQNIQREN